MRMTRLIALVAVALCALRGIAQPAPRPQQLPDELLPRPALEKLYAAEVPGYDPAKYEALYQAHVWVEKYFLTDSAEDRGAIIKALEKAEVSPAAVAGLCRIRLGWAPVPAGVAYVWEGTGAHEVQYFLGLPKDYDRTKRWPLTIRLPALSALVADSEKMPTQDDVVRMYSEWVQDELARHPDAVVIMPRLNLGEFYGPSLKGMNTVVQAMHHVAGKVNIDPARVYLFGHGMGAHAVWNLALHYPTYFAAINPMAGAASGDWQRVRLMNLRNTLPVVWHDTTDKVINSGHSGALVSVLKNFKYEVVFEQTRNVGHVPTAEVVEKLYAAARGRVRELYPKQVNLRSTRPDPTFNRVDWVQVYQPLLPGKEKRMNLRRGTGPIIVNENAHTVQAQVTGPNKIEAKTDNVLTMRFYLSQQMVDLAKPVTVIVNGKTRYEGMIKPSVADTLRDQVFLGRGWRDYTAVLDIDLAPKSGVPATTRATTGPASRPAPAVSTTSPSGKLFFTHDDGKTWFAAPADARVPFTHEGKLAYRAHVFSVDGGKTPFVAYLSKYSPIAGETLVRRPGVTIWAPVSSATGADVLAVKGLGPKDVGKSAVEVFP